MIDDIGGEHMIHRSSKVLVVLEWSICVIDLENQALHSVQTSSTGERGESFRSLPVSFAGFSVTEKAV